MHTTSASLLDRLRVAGDQEAWQRLVRLYAPLLLSWARKSGLDRNDADDLVQEVFTVLVRKLPEFQYVRGQGFRGWLRTILLNKWRDRQRGRARHETPADIAEAEVAAPEPEDVFDAEYRSQVVARALEWVESEFESTTWRAFRETAMHGRPPGDVAAELGISRNAVYVARCRVLRRLHEELDGLLD